MNKKSKNKTNEFHRFLLSCSGVVAIAFGMTIPVVVTSVGVTVDMAQAYLVKTRLSAALDAAALAAAASASDDEEVIEQTVRDFLEANYPEGRIGAKTDVNVSLNGSELTVIANAKLETSFMKIFGFEYVSVDSETVVQREVRGLEVVLVLDNTGSMTINNNIQSLKVASENFISILFDRAGDPDDIRIGVVPYSSSVNVGPYGLGIDFDGEDYGETFVIPPQDDVYAGYVSGQSPYSSGQYGIDEDDLEYDRSRKGQWHGCVLAEDYPLDTKDHSGPWEMYRYDYNGSKNNWYTNNIYRYSPLTTYGDYYNHYYGPNLHCPRQPIVPLTSDQDALNVAVNNMGADGFTLGNYGLVWGWRVLSPEAPYTEGADYDDKGWDKAVLIMTDGVHTMNHAYTAYGNTNEHNINADDLDDRFLEVCNAMKEEGIVIYTVTFYLDDSNSDVKQLYEDCASTPAQHYDAPSQEDLVEAFEKISRELSNLYIKK